MNARAFLGLSLVTAITVLAAVLVVNARHTGSIGDGSGDVLFPGLIDKLNSIETIKVTRAEDLATVRRKGEEWVLDEAGGYPAKLEKVREVLIGLAELETLEAKTERPDRYAKLEVEDPGAKDAKSTRLEVSDAAGRMLADLIVGKSRFSIAGPESLYVRKPGEARAWLARGKLDLPGSRLGWVDQSVVSIDLKRIRNATIDQPGRAPLRVFKDEPEEEDFKVADMPPGTEIKDSFGAEDIARVVQGLTFEAVRPAREIPVDQSRKPYAEYETFDGLVLNLWLTEAEGKTWLAARAKPAGDPAPAPEVEKEIEEINARLTPWRFALPSYELKSLRTTMDDLVQEKKEEKKEGEPDKPGAEDSKTQEPKG